MEPDEGGELDDFPEMPEEVPPVQNDGPDGGTVVADSGGVGTDSGGG